MPASLAGQGIGVRARTEADEGFLRTLYVSIRWHEVEPLIDWTQDQKLAFLAGQFALQRHYYDTAFADCVFAIIEHGGEPIGRLYLDRADPAETRVVDIAFLPQWCGRGLGTAFLRHIQDEARAEGAKVSIHVENDNPARRLYGRLGFEDVERRGIYWLMRWGAIS
ncbi:MAG: GNAT family N-acetyltransferase [Alphaproteobacteria bacterium]|nr:GNAT family N-acetyltransferase [Alphaproteobacteria bacterium]